MIEDVRNADLVDEGLEALARKGQWREISGILRKQASTWMDTGQGPRLRAWIDRMPDDFIAKSPWLLFWSGIVRLSLQPHESREYFVHSFSLFEDGNHIAGMFAAWSGIADSILYTWDDFTSLNEWIAKFEPMKRYYSLLPSRIIKARVAASMFAALMYCQPFHRDMNKWARRAVAASKSSLHPTQRMLVSHQLVTYFVWNGEFSRARLITHHLSREVAFDDAAPMAKITNALVNALYAGMAEANAKACHNAVDQGLKLGEQAGIHLWDGQLLAQGSWGALMQGDTEAAEHYLGRMSTLLNPDRRLEYSIYHNQRGWQALLNRDLPLAIEHTMEAKKLAKEMGIVAAHAFNHQALSLILIEIGEHENAFRHLDRAKEIGRGRKSGMLQFFRYLLRARILFERARNSQALNELRQGLAMGRQHDFWTTPWWHAPTMAQLCMKALDAGIEVEYVRKLIRRRNLIPDKPPLEIENWPWPIRIHTFGGFALQINNKPYQASGKAQQRPLELLKVVIAHGGQGVSQEVLMDALWPEAEGDKAHRAFASALHRLRKLLGHDEIIQLMGKKLSLDERYCWLDVWAVNNLLNKIDIAVTEGNASRKEMLYLNRRLFSLYRGDFLTDEPNAPWLISCRERLRSRLLRQLSRLGHYWEKREEWETAIATYLRILEVDALIEELYQRLMICYQKQSRRAEALAVYARCQQALRARLGIDPSEATEKLRTQILAKTTS